MQSFIIWAFSESLILVYPILLAFYEPALSVCPSKFADRCSHLYRCLWHGMHVSKWNNRKAWIEGETWLHSDSSILISYRAYQVGKEQTLGSDSDLATGRPRKVQISIILETKTKLKIESWLLISSKWERIRSCKTWTMLQKRTNTHESTNQGTGERKSDCSQFRDIAHLLRKFQVHVSILAKGTHISWRSS